jgi:hypothetical protein
MAREFDVYLNGVGYNLLKDSKGRIPRAVARGQYSDPFTHTVSQYERWAVQGHGFRDGGGFAKVNSNPMPGYASGKNIDTRSGDLINGPECIDSSTHTLRYTDDSTISDYTISTDAPDNDGVAVRFTTRASPTPVELRQVGVLLKRHSGIDYSAAANFTVEIWTDLPGRPGALLVAGAQASISPRQSHNWWVYHENEWLAHEYHWVEAIFPGPPVPLVLAASTNYWLCVLNVGPRDIDWGYYSGVVPGDTVSFYNGGAWAAGTTPNVEVMYKLGYYDELDGIVRHIYDWAGSDNTRRTYCAVGAKVMYWDDASEDWIVSKGDFVQRVLQLIQFEDHLIACQGSGQAMYETTVGAGGAWNNIGASAAESLAVHDNMLWKGEGNLVNGSLTGTAWAANTVAVGDPSTPVSALCSHEGLLYAHKPEGLFRIDYPDTYPGADAPTVSQVADFRTDRYPRPFAVQWQSGLYFPGAGGLWEYKADTMTDRWRDRVDPEGQTLLPLRDAERLGILAAAGTTRFLLLGQSSPYISEYGGQIWAYDGRGFHAMMQRSLWTAEPCYAVHIESRGQSRARLWWARGWDIFYTYWPQWTDDRSADANSSFFAFADTNTAEVTLPRFNDDTPCILKDWHQIRVHSENMGLAAGGRIRVFHRIDDATGWSVIDPAGDNGYMDTSPLDTLTFEPNTTGYEIQLRIRFDQHPTDETLKVDMLELLYQPLPDTVRKFDILLGLHNNTARHRGSRQRVSARTQIENLRLLMEETEPWVYDDAYGIQYNVRTMGITDDLAELKEQAPGEGTGWEDVTMARVTMLEVPTS